VRNSAKVLIIGARSDDWGRQVQGRAVPERQGPGRKKSEKRWTQILADARGNAEPRTRIVPRRDGFRGVGAAYNRLQTVLKATKNPENDYDD